MISYYRTLLIISCAFSTVLCAMNGIDSYVLQGLTGTIRALAVSDNILFTGSEDGAAKSWDINTLKKMQTASISTLASWCYKLFTGFSGAKDWDINTGECLQVFSGHTGAIWALAVSGNKLFTASLDGNGTARIWTDTRPTKARQQMQAFAACLNDRCGSNPNCHANQLSQWLVHEIGSYVIPEPWDA